MRASFIASVAFALSLAVGCSAARLEPPGVLAGALTEQTNFGSNPGSLKMFTYVPAAMPASAPLVVVLHGCSQSVDDYVNAGWNELADLLKLYLVYPETPAAGGCFSWSSSADITRDSGQALSIKQMVDYMKQSHSVDGSRVFVTGLSAGGAMTSVMLATYPDVFAAGATMAGVAYRANIGETSTPGALGDSVRAADAGYGGPWPRLSVWQGQSDNIVTPSSATALVSQWTNVHGLSGTPTSMDTVDGAAHATYADSQGRVVVESYLIPNMAHGTALHVPFAPAGGCGQAGAFLLEAGICSTYYAAAFFGLLQPAPPADDGGAGGGSGGGGPGGSGGGNGDNGGGGSPAGPANRGGCAIGGVGDGAPLILLFATLALIAAIRARRRGR